MTNAYALLWLDTEFNPGEIVSGGIYSERWPTSIFARVPVELMHVARPTYEDAKQILVQAIKERCPEIYKLYFERA